jgi:RimJ/RimL family protein N-acetyltransferase
MEFPVELSGKRLKLIRHPATSAHATELFDLAVRNHEFIGRWRPSIRKIAAEKDAAEYIRTMEEKWEAGTRMAYAVYAGGDFVGEIKFEPFPLRLGAEIGFYIDRAHARNGYASEAVGILENHLPQSGITSFAMLAETANEASIRTILKTGHAFYYVRRLEGGDYEAVFTRRASDRSIDADAYYGKMLAALERFKRNERKIPQR